MNHSVPNNQTFRLRRAFTLIEILIVLAITALLFGLLLIPLISALNYTRQAQLLTAAQDAARITRETLTRELGSALYVFDNTSHPFQIKADPKVAGEDLYTNFLDLQILKSDGTPILAHAYNAKLDFVLPKINDSGTPTDPTTGEPIAYSSGKNGSSIISSPSLVFPVAAGTTMVRYWVGLRDPSKSYNNLREVKTATQIENTYILYRAQFQPYKPVKDSSDKVIGSTPNTDLFAIRPKMDANGNVIKDASGNPVMIPELDDPDFFRPVTAGSDVNWLDDTHGAYPAQDAIGATGTAGSDAQHNNRVEKWRRIAKAVIPGQTVDLILLPHASDGKLNFDAGGSFAGVAHSGSAYDPIGQVSYPIINTSVTFRPGTVSGNATPGTTTNYTSQGVPTTAQESGAVYIPTLYTTSNQSWSQPYKLTLTPPSAPSGQSAGGQTYTTGQDPSDGHYEEYTSAGTPVFNITTGAAEASQKSYVPLSINADNGTISFDIPALLDPATDHYKREWVYTPATDPTTKLPQVDLKQDYTDTSSVKHVSPLGQIQDPTYSSVLTARLVPGSLRVYGPDAAAGPGYGQSVLYTEATNLGDPTNNQYKVNYATGVLSFPGPDNAAQFAATPVTVLYDYQANMSPVGTVNSNASGKLDSYAMQPISVAVDYQTRDLISVSLGVRIYDISTGIAQIIPSETKIKIGNSNR